MSSRLTTCSLVQAGQASSDAGRHTGTLLRILQLLPCAAEAVLANPETLPWTTVGSALEGVPAGSWELVAPQLFAMLAGADVLHVGIYAVEDRCTVGGFTEGTNPLYVVRAVLMRSMMNAQRALPCS